MNNTRWNEDDADEILEIVADARDDGISIEEMLHELEVVIQRSRKVAKGDRR